MPWGKKTQAWNTLLLPDNKDTITDGSDSVKRNKKPI